MPRDLNQWSLKELIDHVLRERLVDECTLFEDHVLIVQGSTRFLLDPLRARAFLRGVIKALSPAYRWRSWLRDDPEADHTETPLENLDEGAGLFVSFRQHLIRKWWDRYEQAGCPLGDGIRGLMLWVRHDTGTTTN